MRRAFCGLLLAACASGLQFKMDVNSVQCISEDAGSDEVLVHAQYNVTACPEGATVDLKVTSTEDQSKSGNPETLHEQADVHDGAVTFVSDASEEFSICFTSRSSTRAFGQVEISIDVRTGIDAKDYSNVAKQEHLTMLELELRKLEDAVVQIKEEMVYMRNREEAMRNTNESTNARVLWFSVFSVCVLLSTAMWQVYHLKQYFKKKKLI